MRRRFLNPSYNVVVNPAAKNLILYTTTDGKALNLTYKTKFGDATLLQELYSEGLGVLLFDTDVTTIAGNAFLGKDTLKTITLPESVNIFESGAFEGCYNLVSINIPEGIELISSRLFKNCTSLSTIALPESIKTIGTQAFYNTKLTNFTCPSKTLNIETLAFQKCYNLKKVELSDGIRLGIGTFHLCTKLKTLVLATIAHAEYDSFLECSSLEEFEYTAELIYKNKLEDAIIDLNTKLLDKITKITFGNFVKTVGDDLVDELEKSPFYNFKNLETVEFKGSSLSYLCAYAFCGCSKLKEIDLSKQKQLKQLKSNTFNGCNALTKVQLPPNIKSIPDKLFWNCYNLSEINLHEGITTIGSGAFRNCEHLKYIHIPKSLTAIGSVAFEGVKDMITVDIADVKSYLNINYGEYHITNAPPYEVKELYTHPAYKNGAVFTLNGKPITEINILGITKIPPHAFHWRVGKGCTIKKVTGTWGSNAIIGPHAFRNCNDLYINTTNHVSQIEDYAFYNCKNFSGWLGYKARELLSPKDIVGVWASIVGAVVIVAASIVAGCATGGLSILAEVAIGLSLAGGATSTSVGLLCMDESNEEDGELHANTTIYTEYVGKYAFSEISVMSPRLISNYYGIQVRCPYIDDYAFYNCNTDAIKYTRNKGENHKDFLIGKKAFYIESDVRSKWIFYCAFNNFPTGFKVDNDNDNTINLNTLMLLTCTKNNDFPIKKLKEDYGVEVTKINFGDS